MQRLPKDVYYYNILITLPYQDILYLCQTNQEFNQYCQNDELWIYLLKRDFALNYYDVDAKQQYLKLHYTLSYFSKHVKLITYDVFMIINYHISKQYWSDIIKDILANRQNNYAIPFLNRGMLGAIMDNMMHDYINGKIIKKFEFDINMLYDELNLEEIGSQINTCQDYIDIVTQPSLVFLYGQLTTIQHNLDLYDILPNYFDAFMCDKNEKEIYNYYLNL
jgi:hypothetical protein